MGVIVIVGILRQTPVARDDDHAVSTTLQPVPARLPLR